MIFLGVGQRLSVEYIEPESLLFYERNARTHSDEQIEQIKKSIQEFGFANPVLVDEDNEIIAGHGRTAAALELGLGDIPVVRLAGLSDAQKRALRLADNRIAENSGWDGELLQMELDALQELDFDLDALGFDVDELDDLVREVDLGRGDHFADGSNTMAPSREVPLEASAYTMKTDIPQYVPTGQPVTLADCLKREKTDELLAAIDASGVLEEEKAFLREAAARHTVFHYRNIAEYYAAYASPEMQRLMEDSALVIIDFDDAIKNGFAKLSGRLLELREVEQRAGGGE